MSSALTQPSVLDESAKLLSSELEKAIDELEPRPKKDEPPSLRQRLLRIATALRPEEYLLVVIGLLFAYLHATDVTKVVFKTSFIRAGWHLFIGFIQVFTVVAAWRGYRESLGQPTKPSSWLIGLVVVLPIIVVGLFTAGLLKVEWNPAHLDNGWYGVAALSTIFAALALRAKESGARAKALFGFGAFIAKDVLRFARDWLPFIALLSTYENALRLVGRVRSSLYDPEMFLLDELIFRGHLDVWFQKIVSAKMTEAFAFFYNGLYLFPIVVGMTLYLQWRHREFRAFLLAFIVAGWVGYVGYLLVPVIGPRYYYPELYTVPLYATKVTDGLREAAMQTASEAGMRFLALAEQISDRAAYGGEYPRNCFPSLHTAWGVVVLICSYRYTRPLFYLLAVPLLWMIAATSYLRFHYMVDVLAGVLLAILMVTLMPRLDHAWEALHARVRGLPRPPSIAPRIRTTWDKVRLYSALASFGLFSAFVAAYVFRSDLSREKAAIAQSVSREGASESLVLEGAQPIGARFGDSIELASVRVDSEKWARQKLVRVDLHWRALAKTEGNWKVFVHVRDASGRNIANADHHPVGGAYRIKAWEPGDIVKDSLTLRVPNGTRGSKISLWVGLFDERQVNQRMSLTQPPALQPAQANAVRVLEARLE